VQQEPRDLQHVYLARPLGAIALERAKVVGVAELGAQLLEQLPVAPIAVGSERLDEMTPEVLDHRVVVEQRVVDVEKEHGLSHRSLL